jgi:hypothetical protein
MTGTPETLLQLGTDSAALGLDCLPSHQSLEDPVIPFQHPWFLFSLSFSLEIKYTLKLLQADLGSGIPRFGVRMVLSRGGERGPVALMGSGWPNNY